MYSLQIIELLEKMKLVFSDLKEPGLIFQLFSNF